MPEPALQLEHLSRRFGAVLAVSDASATFHYGKMHALIGENGAGKSTLLKLAGGAEKADQGRVLIEGVPLAPPTPAEAIRRGVGFVYQHFMLVDAFSTLENLCLGHEPVGRFGALDENQARRQAQAVMSKLDLDLDLEARVAELGVGQRQHIEIIRILIRGAKVILLDEPTAVLTPGQATHLYATLRRMADAGSCIVVVTHRLQEVRAHCDHVTVLRRGKVVLDTATSASTVADWTRAIMGQEPPPPVQRPARPEPVQGGLQLKSLRVEGTDKGHLAVQDVSFSVPRGTIVGIAGVEGNGQRELVRAIAGLQPCNEGSVWLDGADISKMSVAARRAAGLAVVHDDRHREGLMLDVSVSDNLVLGDLGTGSDEVKTVARRLGAYGIVPADPSIRTRNLSGGNQQKVVMARALDRSVAVAVLAQPTRGVDLGAARGIHEAIFQTARQGAAVLVISADLAELRAICHEIIVIARGKVAATLPPDTAEEVFGQAMLGEAAP